MSQPKDGLGSTTGRIRSRVGVVGERAETLSSRRETSEASRVARPVISARFARTCSSSRLRSETSEATGVLRRSRSSRASAFPRAHRRRRRDFDRPVYCPDHPLAGNPDAIRAHTKEIRHARTMLSGIGRLTRITKRIPAPLIAISIAARRRRSSARYILASPSQPSDRDSIRG